MKNTPQGIDKTKGWQAVDDRRVGILRVMLSFSALLIIFIDPSEPDRLVGETYSLLLLYCLYSIGLYLFSRIRPPKSILANAHWIDVLWFSGLISLSSGTSSIFFLFYLFAILIASFRWGFVSGIRVSAVSTFLFIAIGILVNESGEFELNRMLLRPIYLLTLGYMISYWGGRELLLRSRFKLLIDLTKLSNPRLGTVKAINLILERVRRFYNAESCLLVLDKDADYSFNWLEADGTNNGEGAIESEETEAGIPLMEIPRGFSISFNGDGTSLTRGNSFSDGENAVELTTSEQIKLCNVLSDLLGAGNFLTIPLNRRDERIGRIYVTSSKNGFRPSDADFLGQLAEQVFPAIENIRLLDSIASDSIDRQRKKISFDIHDSTIQPYIGLKLGLEALEMKSGPDGELAAEIRNLVKMADSTISDLRHFVTDLKDDRGNLSGDVLAYALERQARKFKDYYGISVFLNIDCDLSNNDRLVAELFQMVAEGLSNIRRHTTSKEVRIAVGCEDDNVILSIENLVSEPAAEFVPKSLTERTDYLGGNIEITRSKDTSRVTMTIPKNVEIN